MGAGLVSIVHFGYTAKRPQFIQVSCCNNMTDQSQDSQLSSLESEFIARLADEYKILQDKIDKIGAFRFTIKGWSITIIIASIFAGTATNAVPVWLWLVSLVGFLFLFFLYERQQVSLRYRFGQRCLYIEEEVSRLLRKAAKKSDVRSIAESFTGLHFVPGIGHHVGKRPKTRRLRSKWRSLSDSDVSFYVALGVLVLLFALWRGGILLDHRGSGYRSDVGSSVGSSMPPAGKTVQPPRPAGGGSGSSLINRDEKASKATKEQKGN